MYVFRRLTWTDIKVVNLIIFQSCYVAHVYQDRVTQYLLQLHDIYYKQSLKFHWLTIPTNGTVCCALLYICWLGLGWVIVMFLACHDIHLFSKAIYIYVYIYSAQICIHTYICQFFRYNGGRCCFMPKVTYEFCKDFEFGEIIRF